MEPFGPAILRRKIEAVVAPFQCPGRAGWFEPPEKVFFKTSSKNDQCHLRCSRKNSYPSKVMSMARLLAEDSNSEPKKARIDILPFLGFSDENKIRTIQPHEDALVVTLRILGYDVKRMLVD